MTTYDFKDGQGSVSAHRHARGNGWVSDSASVGSLVYVGPDAKVYGKAKVSGRADVHGNARVYGSAKVYGSARVYGEALVYGNAEVYGSAEVYGNARVFGSVCIFDYAAVVDTPQAVFRSDGYWFTYVYCQDHVRRVMAGCRCFTIEEATEHWKKTRGGTELGTETFLILDKLTRVSVGNCFKESCVAKHSASRPAGIS